MYGARARAARGRETERAAALGRAGWLVALTSPHFGRPGHDAHARAARIRPGLAKALLRWIAITLLLRRWRVALLWWVALLRVALLRRVLAISSLLRRIALLRVASLLRIASHSGLLHATAPVYLAREHGTLGILDIQADLTALGQDHRLIRL